jgi:hypothetical protein
MKKPGQATLLFGGDVFPGQTTVSVSREIQALASHADLVTVNLESPLTTHDAAAAPKAAQLKSSPANIEMLRQLSTNVACLANNHICDWGPEGLLATRQILIENNILTVGAGADRTEAQAPVIVERQGIRVGLLAYGEEAIGTVPAGEASAGCAVMNGQQARGTIGHLCTQVDIVVVQLHWGGTNYHYPFPEQITLGRSLIEAGAAVVVGHHPHVIQGYEHYKDGAILYSLGNLVFTPYLRHGHPVLLSRENRVGMLASVCVSSNGVESIGLKHVAFDRDGRILLLKDRRAERRERFLLKLCRPVTMPYYPAFFRRYGVRRILTRALRWLNPRMWKHIHMDQLRAAWAAVGRIGRAPR